MPFHVWLPEAPAAPSRVRDDVGVMIKMASTACAGSPMLGTPAPDPGPGIDRHRTGGRRRGSYRPSPGTASSLLLFERGNIGLITWAWGWALGTCYDIRGCK